MWAYVCTYTQKSYAPFCPRPAKDTESLSSIGKEIGQQSPSVKDKSFASYRSSKFYEACTYLSNLRSRKSHSRSLMGSGRCSDSRYCRTRSLKDQLDILLIGVLLPIYYWSICLNLVMCSSSATWAISSNLEPRLANILFIFEYLL